MHAFSVNSWFSLQFCPARAYVAAVECVVLSKLNCEHYTCRCMFSFSTRLVVLLRPTELFYIGMLTVFFKIFFLLLYCTVITLLFRSSLRRDVGHIDFHLVCKYGSSFSLPFTALTTGQPHGQWCVTGPLSHFSRTPTIRNVSVCGVCVHLQCVCVCGVYVCVCVWRVCVCVLCRD